MALVVAAKKERSANTIPIWFQHLNWWIWLLLATLSTLGPVLLHGRSGYSSLVASITYLLAILVLVFHSRQLRRRYKKLVSTIYWDGSPINLKIRRRRTWYPYLATGFAVYLVMFIGSSELPSSLNFRVSISPINPLPSDITLQIFYLGLLACLVSGLLVLFFSRSNLALPWLDYFLNDEEIEKAGYIHKFVIDQAEMPVQSHSMMWRGRDDLSKALIRTSLPQFLFWASVSLLYRNYPF